MTFVDLRRDGRTAHVTLDRPDAGNRVTRVMMEELIETLQAVGEADVLVLAGAGDDFCLGRDQSERPAGVSPKDNLGLILKANAAVRDFSGISVALVHGRALGFGSGLALQCDLALAADTAALGFDEISHGFPPLLVQSYLRYYVPEKVALDLVLTGRRLPAHEAQKAGMVSRVVAAADLGAAGAALTERLCSLDPDALRRAKSFSRELAAVPREDRGEFGLEAIVAWQTGRKRTAPPR
jgi:enoyl-CoA hydratase/carnithine racemase